MKAFKTICSLFIILVFIFSHAGAEIIHVHADLQLSSAEKESQAESDWYSDGNDTLFSTSLLPDRSFLIRDLPIILFVADSDADSAQTKKTVQAWKESQTRNLRTGVFSGDAFDSATTVREMQFSLRDLIFLLYSISGTRTDKNGSTALAPLLRSETLLSFNPVFSLMEYDGGEFFSLTGQWKESVFMTISADLSNPSAPYYVFGYAKNQKNYYWSVRKNETSDIETAYDVEVFADDYQTGFKSLDSSALIVSQQWTEQKNAADGTCSFHGIIQPANGLTPIILDATATYADELFQLQAKAYFEQRDYPVISLQIRTEKQDGSLSETQGSELLQMDEKEKELTEAELKKQLDDMFSVLYMSLPEDYLIRMIFMP